MSPVQVAYETYGELNADKSNAIYICHALTGNAHVAGYHDANDEKTQGWWEEFVGPGKSIDTNKYYVICSNFLGGCSGTTGATSINPKTGKPYGLTFPVITIKDQVKVQKMLLDKLGIERLVAVIGGSMGGMNAMTLAIDYPDLSASALLIATTPRLSPQSIAFDAVGRNAIKNDKNFNNGNYSDSTGPDNGLSIARMIGHITYLSDEGMREKFGRELREADSYSYNFNSEFSVETYLDHQGGEFVERFDANCYLYITKAMDYFDLELEHGSLEEAFAKSNSRFFIASFSTDWLFTPEQSREMVDALTALGKDVTYCNIESHHGHDAFILEPETLGPMIRDYLNATSKLISGGEMFCEHESSRLDHNIILKDFVKNGSKVLDLGCGKGELMERLRACNNCIVMGFDKDISAVSKCVEKGLPAINADMEKNLGRFRDGQFDYVVLSKTLQATGKPKELLEEIVRVGKKAVVSFPNFGHIKCRLQLLYTGRAPITKELPHQWYDSPNIHFLSMSDFEKLCAEIGIRIEKKVVPGRAGRFKALTNLFGSEAIYLLSKG